MFYMMSQDNYKHYNFHSIYEYLASNILYLYLCFKYLLFKRLL